ncbi:hypothetical protein Pelo_14402 [Pelomyxa schiedti]|nr:hypothetical protein Pelo_14402 [Pelomyxa schiedti]
MNVFTQLDICKLNASAVIRSTRRSLLRSYVESSNPARRETESNPAIRFYLTTLGLRLGKPTSSHIEKFARHPPTAPQPICTYMHLEKRDLNFPH